MDKFCRDCKHWGMPPSANFETKSLTSVCQLLSWGDSYSLHHKIQTKANIYSEKGGRDWLITNSDFSCNQFLQK